MTRLALVAAAALGCAVAADWLTDGGNPSRNNWQDREKILTPENVKGLKLLWKRELAERAVSSAAILGPIITHRGIKELVFVEGASNAMYAIDADLGRIFWTRKLDGDPCPATPATPVITPEHVATEEDGEGHTPVRPVYFAAGDATLHLIRPTTGEDIKNPEKLAGGCAAPIAVKSFTPAGTSSFVWKGRKVSLPAGEKLPEAVKSLATWEDGKGVRWIYGATATGLQAWTYSATGLTASWNAAGLTSPVIANGMVFAVGQHELQVLAATTGKSLFVVDSLAGTGSLAIANGHICFTVANTVYCFGLPIEI
jgi:hypothetical protein